METKIRFINNFLSGLVGVGVIIGSFNHQVEAGDWPGYRGPAQNGIATESFGFQGKPTTSWSAEVNNGFSSFCVVDGKLFTLELGDGKQETCRALDANTGEELWKTPLGSSQYDGGGNAGSRDNSGGDGPRTTPSFYKGGLITLSAHMHLSRLNPENGEKIWNIDLKKEFGAQLPRWQNAASPIIFDGKIYISAGGEKQSFLCLDAISGKEIWKSGTEDMTHASPVKASIHGVDQIIFFVRSGLVSMSPGDGRELWRQKFNFNVSTAASPVVYEDVVYCSAGYGVGAAAYKVSMNKGEWTTKNMWRKRNRLMNHWSTPVAKDGYLYGMFSFKKYGKGPVKCVRLSDGKEMWSEDGFGPGNVILSDETIIALGDKGQLVLIRATPESYDEVFRTNALKGKCWSTPALSDGSVYIRSTKQAKRLDFSSSALSGNFK